MQGQTPNIHLKEPATAYSLRTAASGHTGPGVPSFQPFERPDIGISGACVCVYVCARACMRVLNLPAPMAEMPSTVCGQPDGSCLPGLEKAAESRVGPLLL